MRQNKSLFPREIVVTALKQSFVKLQPKTMYRNPVMFTVWIGTIIMAVVCLWILGGERSQQVARLRHGQRFINIARDAFFTHRHAKLGRQCHDCVARNAFEG